MSLLVVCLISNLDGWNSVSHLAGHQMYMSSRLLIGMLMKWRSDDIFADVAMSQVFNDDSLYMCILILPWMTKLPLQWSY